MKVAQAIYELKKMRGDAELLYLWDGEARATVEHIYMAKSGACVCADSEEVVYDDRDRPLDAPTQEQVKYWETEKERL